MTSKASKWRVHVEGWRASGKSASAYCAEHGLKVWSLRYWANQLIEQDKRDAAHAVPVARSVRLAQVRTTPAQAAAPGDGAVLLSAGALTLRVAPGFDGGLLRELLPVVLDVVEARR
jgi:hypothetical protein